MAQQICKREDLSSLAKTQMCFFSIAYVLQVSWIRRRDWHILSSGNTAFTKDARFQLHHIHNSQEWTLMVKYLQVRDEGTYVCQVSQNYKTLFVTHLTLGFVLRPVGWQDREAHAWDVFVR